MELISLVKLVSILKLVDLDADLEIVNSTIFTPIYYKTKQNKNSRGTMDCIACASFKKENTNTKTFTQINTLIQTQIQIQAKFWWNLWGL